MQPTPAPIARHICLSQAAAARGIQLLAAAALADF
jgi:hypothetical protein